MLYKPGIAWTVAALFLLSAFGVATVLLAITASGGWWTGIGLSCGLVAYELMAANLFLAMRRPLVERIAGPLDRVYGLHRVVGILIVGALGAHAALIPVASAIDRGTNILAHPATPVILGVVGLVLIAGSVALAMNGKLPYDRWQKVHLATGIAFVIVTAHALTALASWKFLLGPLGIVLALFATVGLVSLIIRIVGKLHGGTRYVINRVVARERAVELVLRPAGASQIDRPVPGQFAFVTAGPGHKETHPFTLIGSPVDSELTLLIRNSGDWTSRAQMELKSGDEIRVDGPYGAFTPGAIDPERPQVWIAGGAGITPFLATIRSWGDGRSAPVHLVFASRRQDDAPAFEEISAAARGLPWLALEPRFSSEGHRIEDRDADTLVRSAPAGAVWFLCGPAILVHTMQRALARAGVDKRDVFHERYFWRVGQQGPA